MKGASLTVIVPAPVCAATTLVANETLEEVEAVSV
jgi:hypothetical protein